MLPLPRNDLTAERLRELLIYQPETGLFFWREPRAGRPVGSVAGGARIDGYWAISLDGVTFKGHRLAWLYTHGVWPNGVVDHINGDPADNRIHNLRDVNLGANQANRRFAANRHGLVGVRQERGERWTARVGHNGRRLFLGCFDSKERAHAAYREACVSLRGEVAYPLRINQDLIVALPAPHVVAEPLSIERLHRLLHYDRETGVFRWSRKKANKSVGKRAGYADNIRGYRYLNIDGRRYYEHRLAWFYVTEKWPEAEIDHINGNPGDNRLENLREATPTQNKRNRRVRITSSSGLKGVSADKRRGTWSAEIRGDDGRVRKHGFPTAEAAHAAYLEMAVELHGDFSRLS